METDNLEKSLKEIFESGKYIVPLYQRNYAWRKNEIEQLLQDIYESYTRNPCGNYFIGSLIVLKRQNGDFEVIDGQQRLTTLSLITRIFEITKNPCLFYDSRPEVEEFFKEFYKTGGIPQIDYPQTIHLRNAIDYINEANLDVNNQSSITINNLNNKESFINYFANNVILLRVEIPEDTDVASYFEIMNNRGVQLQKHEILKSFLMAKIDNEAERGEFAIIWDACSQMDIPIQRVFNAELRKKYFGEKYDDFIFPFKTCTAAHMPMPQIESLSIDEILDGKTNEEISNNKNDDKEEIEEEASEYKSIIDFPNFLMHIFKLKYQTETKDIRLNEKYLLEDYSSIEQEIEPKDFINTLFYCRTIFDRFIIKTVADMNVEDEIKWTLHKPTKYENSWKYTNTFEDKPEQERILKALSMLQVTFRTRIYKNWLQDILKLFNDDNKRVHIEAKEFRSKLDELILKYFEDRKIQTNSIPSDEQISKENSYSLGTNTPHFIFNFIDYLYWVDSKNSKQINEHTIKDFEFKYWNSVEHHLARGLAERNNIQNRDNFIDCLGNLCLISKSSNSRLSDRDVKEKVQTFEGGNLGAKRQVMYNMSKDAEDKYTWTEEKIKKHYNELMLLIEKRKEIL